MPRMGGGRSRSPPRPSSFGGTRSSSPPKPPTPTQSQHPSMFKQMAATAGGVAAGSMIAGALMGGGRESEKGRYEGASEQEQEDRQDPCFLELKNLIACLDMVQQTGEDIKICTGIEKKLIECRQKYGVKK